MRSGELIAENSKLASHSMIDVCIPFSGAVPKQNVSNSFDVATYSRILQQVAKLYPYEHTAISASLSLNNPSSSSYQLPPLCSSNPFQRLGNFSPSILPTSDNSANLSYASFAMKDETLSDESVPPSGEKALDLSTQRDENNLSHNRRITLDQVKHKLVEDVWVENDKKLMWKDSKIAAFNPAQKLFMCLDCEHIGFLSRVAEHWLGSHANLRVFHCPRCPYTSAWSRCVKMHLTRHHNEQSADTTMWKGNPLLMEVTGLMQELRTKVEAKIDANNLIADKRFYCPHCPYATDRRDLYTRHENIHKDDKPFHCYVCYKQFNRADHVKKHFVRMHADSEYDITKIRKSSNSNKSSVPASSNIKELEVDISLTLLQKSVPPNIETSDSATTGTKVDIAQVIHTVQTNSKELQALSSDAEAKSGLNSVSSSIDGSEYSNKSRKKGDKAFTCHYCNWSGSDNWCLKRHMNTHIKPFACVLCDYKAARAERLSTHVFKVHNKKICNKCSFLADTQGALQEHTREEHHNNPYSRRHICSACGMSFDTKANLETHLHLSHTRPQSPEDIVEITPIPMPDRYHGSTNKLVFNESLGIYPYPENLRSGSWSPINDTVKDITETQSRDQLLPTCPHCNYKLTRHQISKDHWLEHHEEVCGVCVHVFTSVYGPQVWKKVVDRPESAEKQCESNISVLNTGSFNDNQNNISSNDHILAFSNSSCSVLREIEKTDLDRSAKRPRKQSYPKKIITLQETQQSEKVERKKQKRSRNKLVFRCKFCASKPKFYSLAQFKLHKLKRHTKRLKQSMQYRLKIKSLNKA